MATTMGRHRILGVMGMMVLLVLPAAGCSNGSESASATSEATRAAYCSAWSDLVTAFGSFTDIDIINQGVDSVRSYVANVESSANALGDAASAQLGPTVDNFNASLEALGSAITSPDLPIDRRGQVRDAAAQVDTDWNDLVDAFAADCPSVDIGGVDPIET